MKSALRKDRDVVLENLAAELTNAVYPVALGNGVGERWLELELELWKALTETIKRLEHAGVNCAPSRNGPPRSSSFLE